MLVLQSIESWLPSDIFKGDFRAGLSKRGVLGNLTPEGFLGLPQPDQEWILFRSQVTEEDVVIKQADETRKWFNQEPRNHTL